MASMRSFTFTSQNSALRERHYLADAAVVVGIGVLLWTLIQLSHGVTAPLTPENVPQAISTDPANLPYYAARTLLRMFIALAVSIIFTFGYAALAARSRRAEKILIPALDILQSVPVLGFLTITTTIWFTWFPHSSLGVECASIFAIFTAQAWNMIFALYQAMVTEPPELDEAARVMRMTKWQRFWKLDVPYGMIPLVWNGMMSFGGSWFFINASEVISYNDRDYALPGIGSYFAAADANGENGHRLLAIAVMMVIVIVVNTFFWRPVTAWAERFRTGDTSSAEPQKSVVLNLLRRSVVPQLCSTALRPVANGLDKITRPFGRTGRPLQTNPTRQKTGDIFFAIVMGILIIWGLARMLGFIHDTTGFGEFSTTASLGVITFIRVIVLLVASTIVWVPIGVWIGLNPKVMRIAQPIVQILASFPSTFLFFFAVVFLVHTGISVNIGCIFLMALGAQWYILFNVIAGASAIPNDLREVAVNLRLSTFQKWKTLYGPAIFASWVSGAITAAGGAWNASIVAEVVSSGSTTLTATGLGAYIADANGNFPRMLVGVAVMSVFVVALNRLFWRRLYLYAERRFSL